MKPEFTETELRLARLVAAGLWATIGVGTTALFMWAMSWNPFDWVERLRQWAGWGEYVILGSPG